MSLSTIETALTRFQPLAMRFQIVSLKNGIDLVHDAYNANPLSMEAAFQTVQSMKKRRRFVAVLGDMKELGDQSPLLHMELGKKAVQYSTDRLFVVGDKAAFVRQGAISAGLSEKSISIFDSVADLSTKLVGEIEKGDIILIKGSRSMKMEQVAWILKEKFGE